MFFKTPNIHWWWTVSRFLNNTVNTRYITLVDALCWDSVRVECTHWDGTMLAIIDCLLKRWEMMNLPPVIFVNNDYVEYKKYNIELSELYMYFYNKPFKSWVMLINECWRIKYFVDFIFFKHLLALHTTIVFRLLILWNSIAMTCNVFT